MGENEVKNNRKILKTGIRKKWLCIAMVICLGIAFLGGWKAHKAYYEMKNKEQEVTVSYVSGKLENIGELATQQLTYSSSIPIEDGSIPFLTKKGFTMEYNATLKAGVDMEDMEIEEKGKTYVITIPHAKILGTAHVDPNSIQFVDEKKAVFNWNTQEDVAVAISKAEEDIESNPAVDTTALLENADENIEQLIHMVLDDSVGDREVEVVFKD